MQGHGDSMSGKRSAATLFAKNPYVSVIVMKTLQCRISGLVQGVGFRYFTLQRARLLGVNGFVRNTSSGDVEVVAQGEEGMLGDFIKQLRVGPRSAHVRNLRIDWIEHEQMYHSFEIHL